MPDQGLDLGNPWGDALRRLERGDITSEVLYCTAELVTRLDHWPARALEITGLPGPMQVRVACEHQDLPPVQIACCAQSFTTVGPPGLAPVRQQSANPLEAFLLAVLHAVDALAYHSFPASRQRLPGESALQQMAREMRVLVRLMPEQDTRSLVQEPDAQASALFEQNAVPSEARPAAAMPPPAARPRLRSQPATLVASHRGQPPLTERMTRKVLLQLMLDIKACAPDRPLARGELRRIAASSNIAFKTVRKHFNLDGSLTYLARYTLQGLMDRLPHRQPTPARPHRDLPPGRQAHSAIALPHKAVRQVSPAFLHAIHVMGTEAIAAAGGINSLERANSFRAGTLRQCIADDGQLSAAGKAMLGLPMGQASVTTDIPGSPPGTPNRQAGAAGDMSVGPDTR